MRFYPSKDCSFFAEDLNAWERQRDCNPPWEHHVDHPEIYWPMMDSKVPKPEPLDAKPKPFKFPVLDAKGCVIQPKVKIPKLKILKKPPVEKWDKVIYYFRDIEGARKRRIEDKDLYFDFPKKIEKRPPPPPREMSLSLRAYRAKIKGEKAAARARKAAEKLAKLMAKMPKC